MSLIKPNRRNKPQSGAHKDTRWDRIRKKHGAGSSLSLKSEAVRKFIEMDFVDKQQQQLLNGHTDLKCNLNPQLVMDLRHEMFQKIPKKLPLATVAYRNQQNRCIAHNIQVEQHYISNELNKFRSQLEKQRKRHQLKVVVCEKQQPASVEALDSSELMRSLQATARHIEDFYAAPIEALAAVNKVCEPTEHIEEPANKQHIKEIETTEPHRKTPSPLTLNEAMLQPMSQTTTEHQRCVRFEQEVEVRNYQREHSSCSHTSDGIESVISDLAEEAILELQMEEEAAEEADNLTENNKQEKEQACHEADVFLKVTRLHCVPCEVDAVPSSTDELSSASTASNHEQNLIIEQLFQARALTNIVVLRKYFLKWTHYTTIEKIEKQNFSSKHDRIHKINAFLDNIRKEKVRQKYNPVTADNGTTIAPAPPQNTKKYQNKIKIQQDIIDLQRVKLERQERMIMELKLNKLSDEAKEARQDIKNELKTFMRQGDAKTKAKAKCLQLIGNLKDAADDEEFARLRGKSLMMPPFLQNMQERALERSVRHEQARQRRLQHEAEREAQKIAADEAKRQEDEEAKRMRIEALREKRRMEKMQKIMKERDRQRAMECARLAQEFCRRRLLQRVGMEGFRRMLLRKRELLHKCELLRQRVYKRSYFTAWQQYSAFMQQLKQMRADELCFKITKRNALALWRNYVREERSRWYVAVDWYDFKLSVRMFGRWYGHTARQLMIEEAKLRQANSHHEWHLKWKVLDRWQRLPQILQLEKETEERRQRWRMKIWELLPDYTPNRDSLF